MSRIYSRIKQISLIAAVILFVLLVGITVFIHDSSLFYPCCLVFALACIVALISHFLEKKQEG